MIHALLVIAVILFVLWLVFHAAGALVNLIWLVIIVLVGLWLFGLVRGRSTRS
jgi:hypothetical protein